MATIKVYNKGKRPIVWSRDRRSGPQVIHPGKYDLFGEEKGNAIISKYEDAVSEEDFLKATTGSTSSVSETKSSSKKSSSAEKAAE